MTVPATDDLPSDSRAEHGNYTIASSVAGDEDERDTAVVSAQNHSRLTLSAILHNVKQELPSMVRSDSEGQDDDNTCPILPVRITELAASELGEKSETVHEVDSKAEEQCHKAEDVDSYMQRASEGLKRHESWAEAVVEMAMKIQGGHQDAETGTVSSLADLNNELNLRTCSQDGADESTTVGQHNQLAVVTTDENAASEQDEQARAEALLRTVAAGPLPAADSLWSDDDEGGC